jgi:hypothetical protein
MACNPGVDWVGVSRDPTCCRPSLQRADQVHGMRWDSPHLTPLAPRPTPGGIVAPRSAACPTALTASETPSTRESPASRPRIPAPQAVASTPRRGP